MDSTANPHWWNGRVKDLATDVPYVPIYIQDDSVALSSKYTWPGFDYYIQFGPYALTIKPK
jgi:hypothetical protein